jgi:hypothetical protein
VSPQQREKSLKSRRLAVSILALMAMAGWSAYAYSSLVSADLEKQLGEQTAALVNFQAQYAAQHVKAEADAKEAASLREQLSAAQAEIQRLSVQSKEAGAELAGARDKLALAQQIDQLPVGSSPDLLRIKPRPTKQDVVAAQEALTQLGFGTLEADGRIGRSTREAIEEFQRTIGLPITGELQAQTLLALIRSAKVMAAQNERVEQPL